MSATASNEAIQVLLVENNLDDLRLVHEVLSETSSDPFDLIAVKSHTEAVVRLAADTIDVILLAFSCRCHRGADPHRMRAAVPHLPIVVVTEGSDKRADFKRCAQAHRITWSKIIWTAAC